MFLELTRHDGVPIYRQIANQIKYQIASGQLPADAELPTIRALAEQLQITPNTVVKAYAQLAHEGLVYKRQGAGTFVAALPSPLARREQKRILQQRADALLTEAQQLGFSLEEVQALLQQRHKALNRHSRGVEP